MKKTVCVVFSSTFLTILISFSGCSLFFTLNPLSPSDDTSGVNDEQVYIDDIQFVDGPPYDSPYQGQEVTISGIVTAGIYFGFFIAEASGPWHSIFVYTKEVMPEVGTGIEITGIVNEYEGMTQIKDLTHVAPLTLTYDITPYGISPGEVTDESLEAVLVRVDDVNVQSLQSSGEWVLSNGVETALCDDLFDYRYFPNIGDTLESVAGVVYYSDGAFKL